MIDRDEVSAGGPRGGEAAKINGPIILGKAVTLRTPSDWYSVDRIIIRFPFASTGRPSRPYYIILLYYIKHDAQRPNVSEN